MSYALSIERIGKRIFLFRGHKVMLDKDPAGLCGVKPIALRQQVRRNRDRFPEDFMFQLDAAETEILVSQNAIPSRKHLGGIAMLSSVLRSKRAIMVNIVIMRAFVKLREMLAAHKDLARRLDSLEQKYDTKFRVVFDAIRKLMEQPESPRRRIGFHA